MNFTEMQKINDLSRELLKQGMAASSEDAARMAQSIIGKESTMMDLDQKLPQPNIELERFQRKFGKQMEIMVEQIRMMANQIQNLKDDIRTLKINRQAPQQTISAPQPARPKGSEPSSRTGNFKPGDVNIEDYFYCGKK